MPQVGLRAVLAFAVAGSVLAACTSGAAKPHPSPTGAAAGAAAAVPVTRHPHAVGVYWNPNRENDLKPFLEKLRGSPTYRSLTWCMVQKTPGAPLNWAQPDRQVSQALQYGERVYLRVRMGPCRSAQAKAHVSASLTAQGTDGETGGSTPSGVPDSMTEYAAFVTEVVRRYAAEGVHGYAFENEVNAANYWYGTPSGYASVMATAANAAHAADPKAVVFAGGVGATTYGVAVAARLLEQGKADSALAFYKAIYARRFGPTEPYPDVDTVAALRATVASPKARAAIAYLQTSLDLCKRHIVDAYQLHFYEPYGTVGPVLDLIRSAIGPMPIVAWETGFNWSGTVPFDANVQAAELPKLIDAELAGGVSDAIYLPALFGKKGNEKVKGLFDPDGKARPAADVFLRIAGS